LLRRTSRRRSREMGVFRAACQHVSALPVGRMAACQHAQAVLSLSGWMLATLEYNGVVGYLMSAAGSEASVNLTDSEWRALIYVASQNDFSAPHLRVERGGESVDMGGSDAQALRSALGKALEARDVEAIKTPDGELAYDTIQRVRHVLLSEDVRLARTRA
jgi:hypothetical protein